MVADSGEKYPSLHGNPGGSVPTVRVYGEEATDGPRFPCGKSHRPPYE